MRAQPAGRGSNRVHTSPLLLEERRPRRDIDERVVVDLESASQSESRVERKGADERARAEAVGGEARRRRLLGRVEAEAGVVSNPVVGRQASGEDIGVRWQRDDVVGARVGEADAAGGKSVEPWRPGGVIAGRAQGIGPERVDRN